MHVMDVVVGPCNPETIIPTPRQHRDRSLRFSDDGPRKFDFDLACWIVFDVPEFQPVTRPEPAVVPRGDGSGKFWEVWDNRTGRVLWVIEAVDFSGALDEKRRLCAGCGGRSGWAYMREV